MSEEKMIKIARFICALLGYGIGFALLFNAGGWLLMIGVLAILFGHVAEKH